MLRPEEQLSTGHTTAHRSAAWKWIGAAFVAWLVIFPRPAVGQGFGQWSWNAAVGLRQTVDESSLDGEVNRKVTMQGVGLEGGVDGNIVSPLLASFRLRLDSLVTTGEGTRHDASNRFGGRLQLSFLPLGFVPFRMYVGRSTYDYEPADKDDPYALASDPRLSTSWGGEANVAQGFLRGLRVGVDDVTTELYAPGTRPESRERQYLTWARRWQDGGRSIRLERKVNSYSHFDLEREDLLADYGENWDFADWIWKLGGTGYLHDVESEGVRSDFATYRMFSSLTRPVREVDLFDLDAGLSLAEEDGHDTVNRASLIAQYRWTPRPGLTVGPFLSGYYVWGGGVTVSSPRAGAFGSWDTRRGLLESSLIARASVGRVSESGSLWQSDAQIWGGALIGTLAHGQLTLLRKEIQFELSRDEFSNQTGNEEVGADSFDLPRAFGVQDRTRARLTIERRNGLAASAWAEWTRTAADQDEHLGGAFTTDVMAANGSLEFRAASLSATAGEVEASRHQGENQKNSYVVGVLSLRPVRGLEVQIRYRLDEKTRLLTPDVDRQRSEILARFQYGRLQVEGRAFESEEGVAGDEVRSDRGVYWSIRWHFGGWLPISAVPERRGAIR